MRWEPVDVVGLQWSISLPTDSLVCLFNADIFQVMTASSSRRLFEMESQADSLCVFLRVIIALQIALVKPNQSMNWTNVDVPCRVESVSL